MQFATSATLKLGESGVADVFDAIVDFVGMGRSEDVFNFAAEFVCAAAEIATHGVGSLSIEMHFKLSCLRSFLSSQRRRRASSPWSDMSRRR
jgi:hypothetical protein